MCAHFVFFGFVYIFNSQTRDRGPRARFVHKHITELALLAAGLGMSEKGEKATPPSDRSVQAGPLSQ